MGTAVKIMKTCCILLLVIAIIGADSSSPSNSCCGSYGSCCAACNHQPSCCSNCCQQSKCCDSGKSEDCCKHKCTPSTCTPPSPTTCPPPSPTVAPPAPPPAPPGPPSPSSSGSSSSSIHNDHTMSTNLRIDNSISNTNKIYVPISINNINTNSLSCSGTSCKGVKPKPPPDVEPVGPIIVSTTVKPTILHISVPQPYPVPVPIPQPYPVQVKVPQPYPIPVPYSTPQHHGCCTVIQPCVEMYCNQFQSVCGDECTHSVMYRPHNPCHAHGCSKRQYWSKRSCQGHFPFMNCGYRNQDCSHCGYDFYKDYQSFEQCHGCFF